LGGAGRSETYHGGGGGGARQARRATKRRVRRRRESRQVGMSSRYMSWRLGFSAVTRALHRPMRSEGWDSALGLDIHNNTLKGENITKESL
jgi:hypothetical protein